MHAVTDPRIRAPEDYNFAHFRLRQAAGEARAFLRRQGVAPGAIAPDFELLTVAGARFRLSGCRGRPVLLRFGSGS
ncbi:MAG TPA: hypothetical protein VII38_06670 [Polyangia bacterium]